jgi:hypothetical protein
MSRAILPQPAGLGQPRLLDLQSPHRDLEVRGTARIDPVNVYAVEVRGG